MGFFSCKNRGKNGILLLPCLLCCPPRPDLKLCLCCCAVVMFSSHVNLKESSPLSACEHRGEEEDEEEVEEISLETWTGVVSLPLAFIKAANWHPRDPKPLDPPADVCSACSELSPLLCLSVCFSLILFSSPFVVGGRKRKGGVELERGGWGVLISIQVLPHGLRQEAAEYHFSFSLSTMPIFSVFLVQSIAFPFSLPDLPQL